MSLQTIEIMSAKIAFDKERTQENRTNFNIPCDCQNCRNYFENFKNDLEMIDFLSTFGIDYTRAEEIISFDLGNEKDSLINYIAYYAVSGSISNEFSFKKYHYSISFCFTGNTNVGHEITDDYFFIELHADLPYLLNEERDLPSPSFLEKYIKKIKSILNSHFIDLFKKR